MGSASDSIRIGIAQMQVFPGEIRRNAETVLQCLDEADAAGAELLVFPEMCLPGYILGDMWERDAFLRECDFWRHRIIAATSAVSLTAVFGTVITDWSVRGEDGRPRKFNAYVAAQGGAALFHKGLSRSYGIKTLLPNYREFEETRHFCDARKLAQEEGRPLESLLEPYEISVRKDTPQNKIRIGVILCEDAWEDDYFQRPIEILKTKNCQLILNLSCSPFTLGKNGKRNRVFREKAAFLGIPLIYANAVSLQNNGKTVFTFDGRSTIYDGRGDVALEMEAYKPYTEFFLLKMGTCDKLLESTSAKKGDAAAGEKEREIFQALRFGVEYFLADIGVKRIVIGVSGGIDSAVAAALHRSVLEPRNILLVNMPSRFNSATTRELSRRLAANLGCLYCEIGIEDSVGLTASQVDGLEVASLDGKHREKIRLSSVHLENVQARDRSGRILAALAAAFGGAFSSNANKAELTVGYSTLYGDLAGYLCPLGDLWKADVYALGSFINTEVFGREMIPKGIFEIVPSAELSQDQAVDAGKGDPLVYPYHDKLFFAWVQCWRRLTPEEILEWYAEGTLNVKLGCTGVDAYRLFPDSGAFIADLEKWWDLYNGMGVAKRIQAPPVLAVSSRAFGFDHREHQGRPFYSSRYLELKDKLLNP